MKEIHDFEDGYKLIKTYADGDTIIEMYNEKNELRFSLQCPEEYQHEALEKSIKLADVFIIET